MKKPPPAADDLYQTIQQFGDGISMFAFYDMLSEGTVPFFGGERRREPHAAARKLIDDQLGSKA